MINVAGLDEQYAIVITSGFSGFTLILTIFGSIMADGYIGKYQSHHHLPFQHSRIPAQ